MRFREVSDFPPSSRVPLHFLMSPQNVRMNVVFPALLLPMTAITEPSGSSAFGISSAADPFFVGVAEILQHKGSRRFVLREFPV